MSELAILCHSHHHGNTQRLTDAVVEACNADCYAVPGPYHDLSSYQAIGFASGIYFGKFHPSLLQYLKQCGTSWHGKKAFLLCTCGKFQTRYLSNFSAQLEALGFQVVGAFHCKGFDTYGPLRLIGGLNKSHPNERDFADAAAFMHDVVLPTLN